MMSSETPIDNALQCGREDTSFGVNETTGLRRDGNNSAEYIGRSAKVHNHNAQSKGQSSFISLVLIADEGSHPINKEDLTATKCKGAGFYANKCLEPGCDKRFKRFCELGRHEQRHSRPWKCPVPTCKYHEYGLPTETDMARHNTDKHVASPPMFDCVFKPCRYKSKRKSNCKQHMENAHGWNYVRQKATAKHQWSF